MKYTTIAVLAIGAGAVLGLTEAQAALRKHALAPIPGRKGWYTTTDAVQFKRGEQIHSDEVLPKGLADLVESAESAQKKGAAKAKALADAAEAAKAVQAAQADPEA